jgi:ABC-type multidrug transport system permease subunit
MKLASVIRKSAREQLRHFWILFLTIAMAPFFVGVYYLISETYQPTYDVLLLNQDQGIAGANYGRLLAAGLDGLEGDPAVPFHARLAQDRPSALGQLRDKAADALVVIPEDFSAAVQTLLDGQRPAEIRIELVGDLTNIEYLVSAVWVGELVDNAIEEVTGTSRPVQIVETSLGLSGQLDDFDLYMPGILILSVIMLMFSATIALVTEVENQTIVRLKLSRVSGLEFLVGVSVVQVVIGIVSVLLTLAIALALGFDVAGSLPLFLLLVILTSISIIAFSLIVAALTRTVNEVLVVGNFPLFLFMFFTGAAFPLEAAPLFSLGGYPVTVQGLMSPTHAISAVKKVLVLGLGLRDILPETVALVVVTALYFAIGAWAFSRRHMRVA